MPRSSPASPVERVCPSTRMWGYPITPAIFILASSAVVVSQLVAQPRDAIIGAAMVAAGWPVGVWFERRRRQ